MNRIPRPSTRIAYLPSEGLLGQIRATKHVYVDTRRVDVDSDGNRLEYPYYEHIFKCTYTGAERRWGTAAIGEISDEPEVPPAPTTPVAGN